MNPTDFRELVARLRATQKHYQKTGENLRELMALEREVDRHLEEAAPTEESWQGN